jgi:hypothetical protein
MPNNNQILIPIKNKIKLYILQLIMIYLIKTHFKNKIIYSF